MRPGMQHLLELLRAEPVRRLLSDPEWEEVIALADEHRVLPFIAGRLLGNDLLIPVAIKDRLTQVKREALHYSFLQRSELQQLLQAFAEAQIPVLPLKGPSLAERLYGDASLRISCDHDLLVHQADFPHAVRLLRGLNFTPDARPDDYHQKWSRGATVVELHFNVENPLAIDFDVQRVWKNARQAEFGNQSAWQLAPQDELRYLCLHGVRHRFGRLSYILDIALASKQLSPGYDLQSRRHGRLDQMGSIVVLGCALAQKLHTEGSTKVYPNSNNRVERLTNSLWSDLLTGPAARLDWTSMHRFYLRIEPTPFRKLVRCLLHLRILLTRLIDDDFRFAAGVGLERPWQVRLLRPARLVLRNLTTHKAETADVGGS